MTRTERARRTDVEQRGAGGRVGDLLERRRRTDERAAVQLDDLLHVRRARRLRPARGREELVVVLEQRVVELSLEADRRRRLRAHRGAAERAGDVSRIDLDSVAEIGQPAQAVEEPLGALDRLDGEIGSRGVADEERVAREHEPRLRPAGAVDHGEGAVLRPVARRVDRPDDDVSELDLAAVDERDVRVRRAGGLVNRDRQPVLECQPSVAGDVIGVRVRLEDADEPHVASLRLGEVRLDPVRGVDEDGDARVLVPDQVRPAAEIVVDELPEEHGAKVPANSAPGVTVPRAAPARPPPRAAARRTSRSRAGTRASAPRSSGSRRGSGRARD